MRKAIQTLVLAGLLGVPSVVLAKGSKKPVGLDEACAEVKSLAEQGDLIFVEIGNDIFKNVADTQNHWASHVGLVFQNTDKEWYVVESTIPLSKKTPLCDYVKKGVKTHIGLKRLRGGLSSDEVEDLRAVAESKIGILYHLGFKYESNRQFCSKLVYQSFDKALGVEIGRMQTFRELMEETEHPETISFWRKWYLGRIPWDRVTVTPGSQYMDEKLDLIYERGPEGQTY